ncbi:MAG: PrsW family intramembrane metalloprotease [Clostridia bacterium]|nr:PrsW family intramembrane metalloprotease [Clostridia bacterium]
MIHIENVFLCLLAPMVIGIICLQRPQKRSLFFLMAGTIVCFLSSYINSFFADLYQADVRMTAVEISPVVEECMKILPFLFYWLVFQPKERESRSALVLIALGFATFENVCWLTGNGSNELLSLLIRGFSAGTMHMVTGYIVGIGIFFIWDRPWLYFAGTAGLLSAAITFHGMYNMLISAGGVIEIVGYALPIVVFSVLFILIRPLLGSPSEEDKT